MKARLIFEDGQEFVGESFGYEQERLGEVVFHTGLTGYQEIISDPSYCEQMICMTYPLIGNYGVNRSDFEALTPFLSAMIVKDYCDTPSNWRSHQSLGELLKSFKVPGLKDIDTRALTRKIRKSGSMKAKIVFGDSFTKDSIIGELKGYSPKDQVKIVSTKSVVHSPGSGKRILVMDFGCKKGILRELSQRGCDTLLVPWDTSVKEIQQWQPDGILLSNGPGDPRDVPEVVEVIKELRDLYPIMGICLGHQLLSLAYGAKIEKLKFGHHGGNHPVKDLVNDKTIITSQNHNYAVSLDNIESTGLKLTHVSLNDKTLEGCSDPNRPVFSIQYHPEACPGPEDSSYLFDDFIALVDKNLQLRGKYAN
ncbi:MAG: carbamoyl phosphate synthase small subunit [Bdellovibrionales bacterium]